MMFNVLCTYNSISHFGILEVIPIICTLFLIFWKSKLGSLCSIMWKKLPAVSNHLSKDRLFHKYDKIGTFVAYIVTTQKILLFRLIPYFLDVVIFYCSFAEKKHRISNLLHKKI